MIRVFLLSSALLLMACQSSPRNAQPTVRNGAQGQYVRPAYLNPAPIPRMPPTDACRAQLYQGLVGQPEGAIFIPGLPGTKRVLKPAFEERLLLERQDNPFRTAPDFIEVRDYLPNQSLYSPSIRTPGSLVAPVDFDTSRLTIELDEGGMVQSIRCG